MADQSKVPNILVVGTPGTGKTTLCAELASRTGLRHISISDVVKERQLYESYDEEFDTYVIDEDKLLDELDDPSSDVYIPAGGCIVEYHGCDFFPERFFHLVVVLRTDTSILWERLEKRGYTKHKTQENVQAEIMQVILEEARQSYKAEIIQEVPSNSPEDLESNLEKIQAWLQSVTSH